jgi:hypothetical protein
VANGAFTQVTTPNQLQVIAVEPTKRYLSCTGTVGGTSPVFVTSVLVGPFPLTTAPAGQGGFSPQAQSAN